LPIKTPLGGDIRGGSWPTVGGMNGHYCPTNPDVIPRTWASSIEGQERLKAETPAYPLCSGWRRARLFVFLISGPQNNLQKRSLMASFSAGTRDELEPYLNCYITEISNLRRRRVAMATFIIMDMNGGTRLEFNSADARQLLEEEALQRAHRRGVYGRSPKVCRGNGANAYV